eukprot:TRINITY_DN187_c3_g1_i1.p1 TRINITY_DN187_c3_g1~~TRINITY_DN187_c3_g1_i1.p1  ORF type:complete len:745 (+),score=240.34 TRINITY_DN187_c3_g1_i1:68-2236(+)
MAARPAPPFCDPPLSVRGPPDGGAAAAQRKSPRRGVIGRPLPAPARSVSSIVCFADPEPQMKGVMKLVDDSTVAVRSVVTEPWKSVRCAAALRGLCAEKVWATVRQAGARAVGDCLLLTGCHSGRHAILYGKGAEASGLVHKAAAEACGSAQPARLSCLLLRRGRAFDLLNPPRGSTGLTMPELDVVNGVCTDILKVNVGSADAVDSMVAGCRKILQRVSTRDSADAVVYTVVSRSTNAATTIVDLGDGAVDSGVERLLSDASFDCSTPLSTILSAVLRDTSRLTVVAAVGARAGTAEACAAIRCVGHVARRVSGLRPAGDQKRRLEHLESQRAEVGRRMRELSDQYRGLERTLESLQSTSAQVSAAPPRDASPAPRVPAGLDEPLCDAGIQRPSVSTRSLSGGSCDSGMRSPCGRRGCSPEECNDCSCFVTDTAELVITGHAASVYSVCFSPDATRVLSASRDKTLGVWCANGGGRLLSLAGHAGMALSCDWSPSGDLIASGADDGAVLFWDAKTGVTAHSVTAHAGSVYCCRFSPSGREVTTASVDSTVKVWSALNGKNLAVLEAGGKAVFCSQFSPDGAMLATGGESQNLHLWCWRESRQVADLPGHQAQVWSCVWHPTGSSVLTAGADSRVILWNVQTRSPTRILSHGSAAHYAVFASDGESIVSAGRDRMLRVWSTADGALQRSLEGHRDCVYACAAAGGRLVSCSSDRTVRVWKMG